MPDHQSDALLRELRAADVTLPKHFKKASQCGGLLPIFQPKVHEGTVVTCGVVHAAPLVVPPGGTLFGPEEVSLDLGYKLADGRSLFVVFDSGNYAGLLLLPTECVGERALVALRGEVGGIVAVVDASGESKVFHTGGVAIHRLRRWLKKPTIRDSSLAVQRHAPFVDLHSTQAILEYCYYELSPRGIGATLVWYVCPPSANALAQAKGLLSLATLPFNLVAGTNAAAFTSLLARHDGAALLDSDGTVRGIGAHLAASEAASSHVLQAEGTRHTSARRYSFDWTESIVFTVSADGPVSIFSEGVLIAELTLVDTLATGGFLRSVAPDRDDIEEEEWSQTCTTCGKTSIVTDLFIPGWRESEQAWCPVCRTILVERRTFILRSRVTKPTPKAG